MALIDFTKVAQNSPVTPNPPSTTAAYDDMWGYYTVEQSIEFDYSTGGLYETRGIFKISGVFVPPSGTDEVKFNAVKEKYNSLNSTMRGKLAHSSPADMDDYGTASDQRTMVMPINDDSDSSIYAIPISLEIEESQWPHFLRYTATFSEATVADKKIRINNYKIDDGVITITSETPRLSSLTYAFANAEELYYTGWNPRSFSVSGTHADVMPSGELVTETYRELANELMDGRVTIKTETGGETVSDLYGDLYIDQSSLSISKAKTSEGISISFTARY